jgi:hypothetical protein
LHILFSLNTDPTIVAASVMSAGCGSSIAGFIAGLGVLEYGGTTK